MIYLLLLIATIWPLATVGHPQASADAPPPRRVIACLGDSITTGLGVPRTEAYPHELARNLDVDIVVEGIPGATAEAGIALVDRVLAHEPWLVIVELGGNDVLQLVDPARTERALRTILTRLLEAETLVLLIEIPAPADTAYGGIYRRLAAGLDIPLLTDVLPAILADPQLKVDSVHPNSAGHRRLATELASRIRPWLSDDVARTP